MVDHVLAHRRLAPVAGFTHEAERRVGARDPETRARRELEYFFTNLETQNIEG
jgi:hypothetical protein